MAVSHVETLIPIATNNHQASHEPTHHTGFSISPPLTLHPTGFVLATSGANLLALQLPTW